ncbi:MAG: hypothetical protein OIF32_05060, partial [Campylobacterales bacterium]|nr:hypothetical protein [Campylobacterales bacterium]
MIKLEFVGNKPIISPKGVTFAQHKHDKFEFIEPAIHILAMCLELNEDHPTEKIDPNETFGQERILETLLKANPDFMKTYEKSMESHKNHLDEEIEAVDETNLSQEDKEAYRNNYKFMK